MGEQGWTLKPGGHSRERLLSVGQGLIELDVGDRLRICRIEPGGQGTEGQLRYDQVSGMGAGKTTAAARLT